MTQRMLVDRTFLLLTALVALSTAALPGVRGYGTLLSQLVLLGAWGIVAIVTSDEFANEHRAAVWVVALFVNLVAFWLVAAPLWAATRRRRPAFGLVGLLAFSAFYIGALFWLFPATDGP